MPTGQQPGGVAIDPAATPPKSRAGADRLPRRLRVTLERWLARASRTAPARLVQRYTDDNLPNWAAAVAYQAFFALFPLLLSLLTLVGLVLRDPDRLAAVARGLAALFPPETAQPILEVLTASRENVGLLGALSVAGLLYGASAFFGSLETVFNQIYRLPNRSFWAQKVVCLGMLLLLAVLLLLVIASASLAAAVEALSAQATTAIGWLPGEELLSWLGHLGSAAISLLAIAWLGLLFLLLYALLPNRRPNFGAAWPGALVATVLVEAISRLFPLYLEYFGHFNRFGAAFGLTLLMLTWLYFLAHIILFGATLNAFLERATHPAPPTAPSR